MCLLINKRLSTNKFAVYLRITIAGKRESIHTGIFTLLKDWDSTKGRIRNTDEEYFTKNNLLAALQTRTTEIYTDLLKEKALISSRTIRARLTSPDKDQLTLLQLMEEHNKYVKRRVGIDVTKATRTKYVTLTKKVQAFLKLECRINGVFRKKTIQLYFFDYFMEIIQLG